jgi:hypothetical protein
MFNFFGMMGNYEDRKVDNFKNEDVEVDTCSVTDGEHDYETAVSHFQYNDKQWVIVESYDTKEEAQEGHNKWVEVMTSEKLPEYLKDCNNSGVSQLGDNLFGETWGIYPKKEIK